MDIQKWKLRHQGAQGLLHIPAARVRGRLEPKPLDSKANALTAQHPVTKRTHWPEAAAPAPGNLPCWPALLSPNDQAHSHLRASHYLECLSHRSWQAGSFVTSWVMLFLALTVHRISLFSLQYLSFCKVDHPLFMSVHGCTELVSLTRV